MIGCEEPFPRVLVVACCFPPHAAIGTMRTLRVVRELHARGCKVTVLTVDPGTYLPNTPTDAALLPLVPSEVRVIEAGALRPWNRLQRMIVTAVRCRWRRNPLPPLHGECLDTARCAAPRHRWAVDAGERPY